MTCQKCNSNKVIMVSGKSSDCNCIYFEELGLEINGYVPYDLNIGGGDYIEFKYCLDCGQIQGTFPISEKCVQDAINS